jgi:transcriptional regulator with XRE-family HTH domain
MLDLRTSLGLRIEELRTALQMSREQLAERVGVDARQIANYELYGSWPDPDTLAHLIDGLGVEIRELFDFTDNRRCPLASFETRLANRKRRSDQTSIRRKYRTPQLPNADPT